MFTAKVSDRDDWFDIWEADKRAMIDVMASNMASDLKNGYDFFGKSIQDQIEMINEYKAEFDRQMIAFADMEEKKVNRWCFYDMKRRGVIE